MRVAYLITRLDELGGAQVHVRDLATQMKARGHDPVVVGGSDGVVVEQLEERGVPVHVVDSLGRRIAPVRDAWAVMELRKLIRRLSPDLISTHSSKAGILGRTVGRLTSTPTIHTAHGWAFSARKHRITTWGYEMAERLAGRHCERVIAVCESDRDLAVRKGIVPLSRIVTVHNAVRDIAPALRGKPGVTPPVLLMVARLSPQKDHATLFRALARLSDLEWHLELVGNGRLRATLENLAGKLGIAERVRFLGSQDDSAIWMARAQALLLVSNWEGFPRSVLEGMRAGLPVIASDVGGVREAVQEGKTGFVVPPGDEERLAERLRTIVENPLCRVQLGGAGRSRYERHFRLDRLVRETLGVYHGILAAQPESHPRLAGRRSAARRRERDFRPAR